MPPLKSILISCFSQVLNLKIKVMIYIISSCHCRSCMFSIHYKTIVNVDLRDIQCIVFCVNGYFVACLDNFSILIPGVPSFTSLPSYLSI